LGVIPDVLYVNTDALKAFPENLHARIHPFNASPEPLCVNTDTLNVIPETLHDNPEPEYASS